MKQEDKELLFKDICARLPYGVKLGFYASATKQTYICTLLGLEPQEDEPIIAKTENGSFYMLAGNVKPYLFPLSSLTEEQRNDISKLLIDTQNEFSPYSKLNLKGCDNLFICTVKQANALINYCLTYHLDINGLIEKGLAIDATGLNIY